MSGPHPPCKSPDELTSDRTSTRVLHQSPDGRTSTRVPERPPDGPTGTRVLGRSLLPPGPGATNTTW